MEGVVCKNIRLKISTKRVETGGECVYQSLMIDSTRKGSVRSDMGQLHNRAVLFSDDKKMSPAVRRQSVSSLTGNKRGSLGMSEGHLEKRQKIDTVMKEQCGKILKQLMNRKDGWIFSKPVDPVELDLPDYFSIITEPMDLGTIKSNLAKNKYPAIEDFAVDVRLTFANAMHYNPPGNRVHQAASVLSTSFEEKWKILNATCNRGSSNAAGAKQISERQMKEIQDTSHKAPPLSRTKRPEEKVELAKTANCTRIMPSKNICKGTGSLSKLAGCSISAKPHLNLATCKCGKSGCTKCRSSISSDSTHTTLSDVSSDRSMVGDSLAITMDPVKQECQIKSLSVSQTSKSDQDSDGAVSALDEESLCHSSQLTVPANSNSIGGWNTPLFDVQLSPEKALRAAKLKSRFADTILKAQQMTLLDQGEKVDLAKLQRESEKLEKRHREERATIEAKIKAAMAAKHQRTAAELRRQRERAREAARIAIEKVVKTVELDEENVKIVKELEVFGCCLHVTSLHSHERSPVACGQSKGAVIRSPLEQLGLFIKPEYMIGGDTDDNDDQAIEEGEIL